jgi:hypothetical protein
VRYAGAVEPPTAAPPPVPIPAPLVIPLASRRLERAETAQALIDGVSAVTLALEARERLGHGGGGAALGWAELAVAALLVGVAATVVRGRAHFSRWVSALAGVVLLLEPRWRRMVRQSAPGWCTVCTLLRRMHTVHQSGGLILRTRNLPGARRVHTVHHSGGLIHSLSLPAHSCPAPAALARSCAR